MAGINWSTYTTNIALNLGDGNLVNDTNFQSMVPLMIIDAEDRICREVDFLGAYTTNTSTITTPGSRVINWTDAFFVVDRVNAISPAGTTSPDSGTRVPLLPISKEALDFLYPNQTSSGVPQYFGRVTQSTAILGPFPDGAYTLEVTGTQRPTTLSATNTTTFISTYLADLFVAASMIYASGYLQNFSSVGDNPQMATNWDGHYKDLLASATIEEARKKFSAEGWSPKQPSQIATPPRT